ncbi:hypothetical protein IMSAGC020_01419 [Lachnospiraceae bacterium]|nr:hypothetical protein IMSAGC020_01419 [Lachnospiraceae bacterium]
MAENREFNSVALFHTSFIHNGHQWLRRQFLVYSLGDHRHNVRPFCDVVDLVLNSPVELLKSLILGKRSFIRCYLFAVPERNSVVQRKFNGDRPLCIRSRSPLI